MSGSILVSVKEGDVIDLRGAEIRQSKDGRRGLIGVIRNKNKSVSITLLADSEDKDLLVGRITRIKKVANLVRMYYGNWKTFTNVYCEFENAFGEEPKYVCENSPNLRLAVDSANSKRWKRPAFLGGEDAEEEE